MSNPLIDLMADIARAGATMYDTHYDHSVRLDEDQERNRMAREAEDRNREYMPPEQRERERLEHDARSARQSADHAWRMVEAAMQMIEKVADDERTPEDHAWKLRQFLSHDDLEIQRVPEPWLAARWPWRAITALVGDKAEPVYWEVQKVLCAFREEP